MAYFERLGEREFRATEHVGGAWREEEQHVAPALGLLTHVVEQDLAVRRGPGLRIGRLSFDILGTMPVDVVTTDVVVRRPGRTVELVEATLSHAGRPAVLLRAWVLEQRDTTTLAGTPLEPLPGPEEHGAWTPTRTWPGGFIRTVRVHRDRPEPGRATFWVRSGVPLLAGEPVGATAHAARLFDIANGMAVRADPRTVAFPNLDLTAHLFREPAGEWVGFDTKVSFGPDGIGLTSSRLHDGAGPFGTLAQVLTVRPG